MCFNSSSQQQVSSSGVPIPQRKPAIVNNSDQSVLGSIWNGAKGIFEQIATIELERYETDRLLDIRKAEEEAKIARQQDLAGRVTTTLANNPVQTGFGAVGIGMIGFAVVLLLTRR
jgi:hypothetical protein